MPRQSLVEYLEYFSRFETDVACAHRRGYRQVRWTYREIRAATARFARELRTQYEESGIRGLLDAHAEDVVRVEWGDGDVLADMDLPSDYRRELKRFAEPQ